MSEKTSRGRHAAMSKKNVTRVTASVAVTGGLVAGVAALGTSGTSSADPATPAHAATAAHSPKQSAPVTQHRAAAPKPEISAATVADKKVQHSGVSRAHARRALTQHHTATAAVPAKRTVGLAAAADKAGKPASTLGARRAVAAKPARATVQKATAPTVHATTAVATTATTSHSAAAATPASSNTSGVTAAAQRYSGIPYVWGGASTSGADCSGYVLMVYKSVGKNLPHSSSAMQAAATPVSTPRPGDLVFTPGHVGIYASKGKAYQALHPGTTSGLHPIYGSNVSYGRV